MEDDLDIPEFLRRQPDEPQGLAGAGRKAPRQRKPKRQPFHLPKTIEPAGLALLKQIEREKAERQKARFAALRELNRNRSIT